ncbi:glycosyltransferase [Candidatus Gracilibacteria bacterium]|nr:glycosyltransferase [Candidatus Gracilibacteria bacterium]
MSNENPVVSIVIPFFNHGKFLEETLESLLDQTFQDFEILVIDDASTDNVSLEILKELEKKYDTIKIFHNKKNSGPAFSRNFGVKQALGEFILPIDADDKIEKTFLEKALFLLKKHPKVHFIYPYIQHFDGDDMVYKTWNPYNFYEELFENKLCICSLIRKSSWENVGGYNENLHKNESEDWDFWIKMGTHDFHGMCLPEPLFLYRKSQNIRLKNVIKNYDKIVENLRKRHKNLFSWWALQKTKLEWKKKAKQPTLSSLSGKVFARIPKPLQKTAIKFFEAELLEKNNWKKSPLKCFQLMIPLHFRKKINKRVNKNLFHEVTRFSEYFLKNTQEILPCKKITTTKTLKKSKKETILFFLPWIPLGGVESVTLTLLKLLKDDYNFILITTQKNKNIMHSQFAKYAYIYHFPNLFFEKDNFEEQLSFVQEKIVTHKIKKIFITNSYLAFQFLPSLKFQFPYLQTFVSLHGYDDHWDFLHASALFWPFLDKIICVSNTIKERFQKQLLGIKKDNKKIVVINNTVDFKKLTKGNTKKMKKDSILFQLNLKKSNQKNILFLGRYEWDKNPLLLLDIAKYTILEMRITNIRFFFFGEGSLEKELKFRAEKINKKLKKPLIFVGKRQKDLKYIFSHTDLTVNTSPQEGFGLTMIESLFFSVPVCGFDLPVFKEILPPKYSFLVSKKAKKPIESFSQEIFTALQMVFSKSEKEEMQKYVLKKFSEKSFIQKYREVLDN